MEIDKNNKEYRAGAFFGFVACVLVLTLTAMAFNALDPPSHKMQAVNWNVSVSEPEAVVLPSFGA